MSEEFQKFVFTLPLEDQNIEINKIILQTMKNSNVKAQILYEAYCEEKHFPEYFNIASMDAQEQAVNALQSIKTRNQYYDNCLWDRGFKNVNLNHKQLYKKDSDLFIDYFSSRTEPEKKTIITDIMNCDYTNKQVAKWLEKNEVNLLRKVSMDE